MKFKSFPHGLLLGFAIFAISMVSFAYYAANHKDNLVSKTYYTDDFTYQETINKKKNLETFPVSPTLLPNADSTAFLFSFPDYYKDSKITGYAKFQRPDNPDLDDSIGLTFNEYKQAVLLPADVMKGSYNLIIDFLIDDVPCYIQKKVYLNPRNTNKQ